MNINLNTQVYQSLYSSLEILLPCDFSDDGVDRILFISDESRMLPPPVVLFMLNAFPDPCPNTPLELTNDFSPPPRFAPRLAPRYVCLSVTLPSVLPKPKPPLVGRP